MSVLQKSPHLFMCYTEYLKLTLIKSNIKSYRPFHDRFAVRNGLCNLLYNKIEKDLGIQFKADLFLLSISYLTSIAVFWEVISLGSPTFFFYIQLDLLSFLQSKEYTVSWLGFKKKHFYVDLFQFLHFFLCRNAFLTN